MRYMNILITGGAGFIGSHFVKYMVSKYPHYNFINVDALTYAGNSDNLAAIETRANYRFIKGDISDPILIPQFFQEGVDVVVNFAAETHVDRSILEPDTFVNTNLVGTQHLLAASQQFGIRKFIQISTDEVYGSLGPDGYFFETSPLAPNSPYSATKAGADLLVRAYHKAYNLPINITRCSNNYGSYQFPDKLIPLMIIRALNNQPLPVYGNGMNVRDWIHVMDHCEAIDKVLHHGKDGEIYNIGAQQEKNNLEIIKIILEYLNRPASLITFVDDRPAHDYRYAINSDKIRFELDWTPHYQFEDGMKETIRWYLTNKRWYTRAINRLSKTGRKSNASNYVI